jgi:hypothetical protein
MAGWRTSGSPLRVERFNEDFFRELSADPEADIADLANDVRLLGEKADFLLFAKTHFAQAMLHFRRSGKLLDADGSAGADAIQWADKRLKASCLSGKCRGTIVHQAKA